MRKYICLSNSIIALFLLALVSCEGIFIPDPIDPRLPKYTEKGYNAAGAFINKDVWKSVDESSYDFGFDWSFIMDNPTNEGSLIKNLSNKAKEIPMSGLTMDLPYMRVYNNKDSIVFRLDGHIMKGQQELTNSSIVFHLRDLNIHSFGDLKTLKNKKIQLDGVNNYGAFSRSEINGPIYLPPCSGTAGIGQIYFRNVIMNDSLNSAIISGTFGFTITNSDCGTTEVSYGRFDSRFQLNSGFQIN